MEEPIRAHAGYQYQYTKYIQKRLGFICRGDFHNRPNPSFRPLDQYIHGCNVLYKPWMACFHYVPNKAVSQQAQRIDTRKLHAVCGSLLMYKNNADPEAGIADQHGEMLGVRLPREPCVNAYG